MFYLDCSCSNLSMGIFLEFLGFSDYFSCFKVFSELFSGITYALKSI
jgi:hypothetical protein